MRVFASYRATMTRMTKRASLATILRKVERPADRSALFHWMVEHHDKLLAAGNGARLVWADLCVSFAEMGLTCRTGQPATPAVARLTWYRARKLVAQRQAAAQRRALTGLAPRSLMPSASPRARTPIENTKTSAATEPALSTDGRPKLSQEEVQARRERLRKAMTAGW